MKRKFDRNSGSFDSKHSQIRNQVNIAESQWGEVLSLEVSTAGEILYSIQDVRMWLLDSGATFHVTPHHEWFSDHSADVGGIVWLGNEQECRVIEIGEIPTQLPNANNIILHHVWYVPELKMSLVSIGMLVEDGYRTTLGDSSWQITRENLPISHGRKYNNLYPLRVISPHIAN